MNCNSIDCTIFECIEDHQHSLEKGLPKRTVEFVK